MLGPKGLLPAAKNEGTLADDADGLGSLVKELKNCLNNSGPPDGRGVTRDNQDLWLKFFGDA